LLGRRRLLIAGGGVLTFAGAGIGARAVGFRHSGGPSHGNADAEEWSARCLDPHSVTTLTMVCEHIVPGATEARACQFVDTIFEAAEPLARTRLRDAILLIDEAARKGGAASFREAASEKQLAILQNLASEGQELESTQKIEDAKTTWLSRWSTARPSGVPETLGPEFLQIMRMLTIYGYYASPLGVRALGREAMFHSPYPGCTHAEHGYKG
jgi:Gluconate 2-dehydrogenase subunit 3